MNCAPNCESCRKNLYTINGFKKEDVSKSLILPQIMPFTEISALHNGSLFPPLQSFPFYQPFYAKNDNYNHPFPPLLGLNMKFGSSNQVTFPRAKIDFSVESIITPNNNNKQLQTNADAIIRSNVANVIAHSKLQEKPNALPPEIINEKPASLKNRGRPSADSIHKMTQKSLENPQRYQCSECNRSFPRKKSLDTHRLTHSDIKPYACDFPGCVKRFKQSGQLKTHLRLHTGEKPFHCTFPLCPTTFAHANRKCPHHPEYPLQRTITEVLSDDVVERVMSIHRDEKIESNNIKQWLQKQFSDRLKIEIGTKVTSSSKTPPRNVLKSIENLQDKENIVIPNNDHPKVNISEESNRRMLSAVALVELQAQAKSQKKVQLESLFSLHE